MESTDKEEVYGVFLKLGLAMKIQGLPKTHSTWLPVRNEHLESNYEKSKLSIDLINQYRKNLGSFRFMLLKESYSLVVPDRIISLLHLKKVPFLKPLIPVFNLSKRLKLDWFFKNLLFPKEYQEQIKKLDLEA